MQMKHLTNMDFPHLKKMAEKGTNYRGIAKYLNAKGYVSFKGLPISPSEVSRFMILNGYRKQKLIEQSEITFEMPSEFPPPLFDISSMCMPKNETTDDMINFNTYCLIGKVCASSLDHKDKKLIINILLLHDDTI